MNKKALVFAVAAACLTSGAAFAQSYDHRGDRGERDGRYERNDGSRYDDGGHHGRDNRYSDQRDYGRNERNYHGSRDYNGRYDSRSYGYRNNAYVVAPRYQMRRGERFSYYDRGDYRVVSDWNHHNRLYAPQRGYQWVQVGGDYALVAIATGIIAHVLLNN